MLTLFCLFVVPFISALLVFLFGLASSRYLKEIAALLSLIPLAMLLMKGTGWLGASEHHPWIPFLSIEFFLSVDGLSLLFLFLTAIIVPVSILSVDRKHTPSQRTFYALILLLQGLLIGFFTSRDLALFTVFWEAMLLPLYFIIAGWGSVNKENAAIKFLIYMVAGSCLMVAAVLALYFSSSHETFNLDQLASSASSSSFAPLIFGIFLLAFAVKTPLFPFHAWLPDAYCRAPLAGTILLSAILSKAGIYGIARIGYGLFPALLKEWSPLLLSLAIAGALYGALVAWKQNDYKRLIAYSSFSHVNFILAGLFIWNEAAQSGALLQAFNHGITIAALFLAAGWLEKRLKTTTMGEATGLAKYLPRLCWITLVFVLSSVALPSTNNFVGEFMVLFGLFGQNGWLAALLGLTVILSVVYMLRFMQSIFFGKASPIQHGWNDLSFKEVALAIPLIFLIFWVGLHPGPLLSLTKETVSSVKTTSTLVPL